MKNVNTQNISSLSDYDRSMSCFGMGRAINKKNIINKNNSIEEDAFIENFEEVTNQIKLFEYISSGLDENIETIIKIIKSDPKRNIYDISQKNHYFVNKKNYEGYTALYIACLNGHTKIVDILLTFHADHLIKCGNGNEEESILEVAIRWSHMNTLDLLLRLDWPIDYLKAGYKEACSIKNELIIKRLKRAIADTRKQQRKNSYSCCFG